MPGRGCLIAICGIDGSGKTVQTAMLCRRAQEAGWLVRSIEFPRYGEGFFGPLIARYLRGDFAKDPAQVSPYLAALPFACDRWEAGPTLRRWLEDGALVVCNRYVAANLAHQGGKIQSPQERAGFLRWVEKLEYEVFALPLPDLQVWLDMPPEVAVKLIACKKRHGQLEEARDIHESSLAHLEATRAVYHQLASATTGWATVKCASEGQPLPPERIAEELWRRVKPLLDSRAR